MPRTVEPVIPGYDDLVEIGRGGFAVVYRARDGRFDRTVALKVLLGQLDEVARARFERECRAMGVVSRHPHCVTVYDSGFAADGHAYLVMEDMTAGALAERLPLPWPDAVDVGVKIAAALHAAHATGVLHRDIKPENVLVSAYDEPKLGDFGIARLDDGLRTRTGALAVTPAYAAPELFEGAAASEASDVYSLAATLFALVAGAPPFVRDSDESLLPMIARVAHEPVPDLRPRGVPEPVCRAIETGMEKSLVRRVDTALEYGRRLQDAQRDAGREPTRMIVSGAPPARADASFDPGKTVSRSPRGGMAPAFWFHVEEPTTLVSPYDHEQAVGMLQPGEWYLAGEENGMWVFAADGRDAEGWVPLSAVRRYEE